jgi:hypothetical protein
VTLETFLGITDRFPMTQKGDPIYQTLRHGRVFYHSWFDFKNV